MSNQFLEGIRVLDLSRLLPGPFLTMILADLGADVVKVEDPRMGDYMRQFPPHKAGVGARYLAINRNKRSLALDLKSDAGRAALLKMSERADVVVESFRPGVMDRLGVGFDQLRARNPGIIMCSISGFGKDGPYRDKAGHDINYIGLAGVLAMGGNPGAEPLLPGVQIADLAGGALWSASGILAALVGRGKTGEGAHLDISMTEGSMALLAAELGALDAGGPPTTRGTGMLNGGNACYGVYETSDGKYLSVGALEPKFWAAFNTAIGRNIDPTELIAPPERQRRVREEIQAILKTKTRQQWSALFAEKDCLCEPVLELPELVDHPLHEARNVFFDIETPDGPVKQMRTPLGEPARKHMAPKLGEQSREVLEEYGLSEDQIEALI